MLCLGFSCDILYNAWLIFSRFPVRIYVCRCITSLRPGVYWYNFITNLHFLMVFLNSVERSIDFLNHDASADFLQFCWNGFTVSNFLFLSSSTFLCINYGQQLIQFSFLNCPLLSALYKTYNNNRPLIAEYTKLICVRIYMYIL